MQCENLFCVYWVADHCRLEEVTLDIQGNCQDCVYLSLPKEFLAAAREEALLRFQQQ